MNDEKDQSRQGQCWRQKMMRGREGKCRQQGTRKDAKMEETATRDFPGGPMAKNVPCSAGAVGSIPG